AAVVGAPLLGPAPIGSFVVVGAGGIAIGLAIGWLIAHIRTQLSDLPVEITVSLLTPYAAYLPAEVLGASGVLAAVTAGLYLGRRSSRIMGSDVRLAARAVWEMLVFLLNGIVFLLVGLQIAALVRAMSGPMLIRLVAAGLAVSVILFAVRALWIIGMAGWQRLGSRRQPVLHAAEIAVLSWTGMRGAVSLAAALAMPLALPGGSPLPAPEAVIGLSLPGLLVSLVGQGVSLPFVIKAVRIGGDAGARAEEQQARRELVDEAVQRIDELYGQWPGHRPLLDQLRATYLHRAEHFGQFDDLPESAAEQELVEHRQIRRSVIDAQRESVLLMRDRGAIDDDVLRTLERELDLGAGRMEA